MSAYIYIIKMNLLTSLSYSFDVFSSFITSFIIMVAGVFVWKAAYVGIPSSVEGVNESQMVTYIIISFFLSSIFVCNVDNSINYKIRKGDIVSDFIRPLNPFFCWLMEDIGEAFNATILRFVPLLLVSAPIFRFSLPGSIEAAMLFVPSCILSYSILWLISAITGLLAFWIIELGNMRIVKNIIITILSGSMVPLWFFPKNIQDLSRFLPFQYTYQTPLGIYIGKITIRDAIPSILLQMAWVIILSGLTFIMWKRAKRKLLVQGG
ncbi:MAG: ABC-2 family transporter protein [Ruminiclostridium sp.]|nr:ABC-2 family transporter protein [Ruminiclostridium sp.]